MASCRVREAYVKGRTDSCGLDILGFSREEPLNHLIKNIIQHILRLRSSEAALEASDLSMSIVLGVQTRQLYHRIHYQDITIRQRLESPMLVSIQLDQRRIRTASV